jgi:hypothetical protein
LQRKVQVPPMQALEPFGTALHARPHAPQLVELDETSMHTPLHAVKPALQAMPQAPLHTALPCGGAGHDTSQAPQ